MAEGNEQRPKSDNKGSTSDWLPGWLRRLGMPGYKEPGVAGLAIFLYFLLADAAVETFVSGSPVRWWVVSIATVYLGGSAALWWRGHPLWQRFGWLTVS